MGGERSREKEERTSGAGGSTDANHWHPIYGQRIASCQWLASWPAEGSGCEVNEWRVRMSSGAGGGRERASGMCEGRASGTGATPRTNDTCAAHRLDSCQQRHLGWERLERRTDGARSVEHGLGVRPAMNVLVSFTKPGSVRGEVAYLRRVSARCVACGAGIGRANAAATTGPRHDGSATMLGHGE